MSLGIAAHHLMKTMYTQSSFLNTHLYTQIEKTDCGKKIYIYNIGKKSIFKNIYNKQVKFFSGMPLRKAVSSWNQTQGYITQPTLPWGVGPLSTLPFSFHFTFIVTINVHEKKSVFMKIIKYKIKIYTEINNNGNLYV